MNTKGFNSKGFDKPLNIRRSIVYIFIFLGIAEAIVLTLHMISQPL